MGASTTQRTTMHTNVLHTACLSGNFEILELLIRRLQKQHKELFFSMLNEQDRYHGKALCYRVHHHIDAVHHFIDVKRQYKPIFLKKSKTKQKMELLNYGEIYETWFCTNPDSDMNRNIENRFKVEKLNIKAPLDQTPLHVAIEGDHTNLVNLLLKQDKIKTDIKDYFGLTPVMMSAAVGNLTTIQKLEKMGCDLSQHTERGESITDIAKTNEHDHITTYLKNKEKHMYSDFSESITKHMLDNFSLEKRAQLMIQGLDVKQHLIQCTHQLIGQSNNFIDSVLKAPPVTHNTD